MAARARDSKGRFVSGGKKRGAGRAMVVSGGAGNDVVIIEGGGRRGKKGKKKGKGGGGMTIGARAGYIAAGGAIGAVIASALAKQVGQQGFGGKLAAQTPLVLAAGGIGLAVMKTGLSGKARLVAAGVGAVGLALVVGGELKKKGDPGVDVVAATTPSALPAPGQTATAPQLPSTAGTSAPGGALLYQHREQISPGALGNAELADGVTSYFNSFSRPQPPAGALVHTDANLQSSAVWGDLGEAIGPSAALVTGDPYAAGQDGWGD